MMILNSILEQRLSNWPQTRDAERGCALVRKRNVPDTHAFTSENANEPEDSK